MLLILFNLKGLTESIPIIKNSEDPLLIKVQLKKDTLNTMVCAEAIIKRILLWKLHLQVKVVGIFSNSQQQSLISQVNVIVKSGTEDRDRI